MKNKREPNKRKPIREVDAHKAFDGEASPYWDFINSHQRQIDEGNPLEHTLANPDVLSEEDSLYHRPLSEDGEIRLRAIREAMQSLSPQQLRVLNLCGSEGLTLQAAADIMGIKLGTAQTLLSRARAKIVRIYDREKRVS